MSFITIIQMRKKQYVTIADIRRLGYFEYIFILFTFMSKKCACILTPQIQNYESVTVYRANS